MEQVTETNETINSSHKHDTNCECREFGEALASEAKLVPERAIRMPVFTGTLDSRRVQVGYATAMVEMFRKLARDAEAAAEHLQNAIDGSGTSVDRAADRLYGKACGAIAATAMPVIEGLLAKPRSSAGASLASEAEDKALLLRAWANLDPQDIDPYDHGQWQDHHDLSHDVLAPLRHAFAEALCQRITGVHNG